MRRDNAQRNITNDLHGMRRIHRDRDDRASVDTDHGVSQKHHCLTVQYLYKFIVILMQVRAHFNVYADQRPR